MLVDHALAHFSTDNLSCMVVRFDKEALVETQNNNDGLIGVEGDEAGSSAKPSEADKIVSDIKQKIAEGGTPAIGVSASNSGRGHDSVAVLSSDEAFKRTTIEGSVEEEPAFVSDESLETTPDGSILSNNTEGSATATEDHPAESAVPAEVKS
jgi:protein phosphatase PTC1